ncbi:MAG: hypothetical protein LBI17_01580 [Rickettsiales bacterium]|nr:hypothetical protein [Rickettsiales bacterium]
MNKTTIICLLAAVFAPLAPIASMGKMFAVNENTNCGGYCSSSPETKYRSSSVHGQVACMKDCEKEKADISARKAAEAAARAAAAAEEAAKAAEEAAKAQEADAAEVQESQPAEAAASE